MNNIYIGNLKTIKTEKATFLSGSICLSDIPKEHITESKNGKKYLNITIWKNREIDKYDNTHNIQVNTWRPEKKDITEKAKEIFEDDIPF